MVYQMSDRKVYDDSKGANGRDGMDGAGEAEHASCRLSLLCLEHFPNLISR